MTQRSHGWRWARAGAVVAGAMAAVLIGGPALAAGAVGVIGGAKNDFGTFRATVPGEMEKDYYAGRITLKIDGGVESDAYCIDIHHELGKPGTEYQESSWTKAGVKNLESIKWVLTHGYPSVDAAQIAAEVGVPATTTGLKDLAYTGTQAAIWHFSDGLEMSKAVARSDNETIIRKIYQYLVDKANNAGSTSEPAPTLKITPDKGTGTVGSLAGPYTVQTAGGEITLTATGGKVVDQSGNPITSLKNGGKFWVSAENAGEVTVTAAGEVEVPVGRVFVHGSDQKIILATKAKSKLSTEIKVTFASAPMLPVTGTSVAVMVGIGLALLVAGALAVMTFRRRRIRFTAA